MSKDYGIQGNGVKMVRTKYEKNGSVTFRNVPDGTGKERHLNVHAFRTANEQHGQVKLAILDLNEKLLGSVVLDPELLQILIQEVMTLV